MRALQNCDFCAVEAVGTFEVVPPELDPTEAEQRRVVLCDDCETRLSTLIEPLLARAGTERHSTTDEATDESASRSTSSEPTRSNRTRDSGEAPSDTAAEAADGTALEHERTDATTGDESPTDESTSDGSTTDGKATENRASGERAEANPAPPAYGKVVRLLRNRTFPMERRAVESLAAGAYDLESHEVEAIIEHALEDGEFTESGGELRRP
ncbi:hypothetical protein [Natronococcus wangiae]|uniref:hypothetical protein n=1 Tax=Natronococcus wangiae TaxID=3068275 RepID=UPI00273E8A49|nr:hypothetical protein [Natronococcus sp. AD5]